MSITIKSSRFRDELKRRRDAFREPMSAVLKVPPDLWWIYLQEHGTALRGDKPTAAFDIYPTKADRLSWIGPDGHRIFMKFVKGHPGIPAQHFIAEEEQQIRLELAATVAKALMESGWDFAAVKEAFLNIGMDQVKQRVAEAIATKLGKDPRSDGKLHGEKPAELFKEGAYIEER